MGQQGLTVMFHRLFGDNGDTKESLDRCINKEFESVSFVSNDDEDNELVFDYGDFKLVMWDDGQSCCESRYMTTDDDLKHFDGATLTGARIEDGPEHEAGEYDEEHEEQFLIVETSLGSFTMVTHNEHNGYYGGFLIKARIEENIEGKNDH